MTIIIIGASALAFLVYLFCYRYFGIDARIQMFIIHTLVVAVIAALVVLLWISVANDMGSLAVTGAIAALSGFGALLLKYFFAEFLGKKN